MDQYSSGNTQTSQILIVDDESMIRDMIQVALERRGYSCTFADNGKTALEKLHSAPFDIIIADIDMPVMGGIELTKIIKSEFNADVIIMTGKINTYQYDEIIDLGASDFVEKPFSPKEMILRIDRVLKERCFRKIAQESHENLKESYVDSIHRLVMAAEFKDENTGDHVIRIGEYCPIIAEKLNLSSEFIENIYYAAPMHDIGKIGIPDKILLKPGKLTDMEFDTIKTHTHIGAKLLSQSKSKILQMAEEIALTHHEKFNGKGYPQGLKNTAIPISGRIVAIADTFDAITSKRPYKEAYPPDHALSILKKERGAHFDPDVLDMFIKNFDKILEIKDQIGPYAKDTCQDFTLSQRDRCESSRQRSAFCGIIHDTVPILR